MSQIYQETAIRLQGVGPRPRVGIVAIAILVTFSVTLAVALLQGPKIFYYDSGGYWGLGQTFTQRGHFSLLNFTSPLRGYLLPLIDHVLQQAVVLLKWNYSSGAKLFNVGVFTLIGAVLAPRFAETTWPTRRWGIGRRMALAALLIIFWSGYLAFPLSDFPALAVTLLALVSVDRDESPGWMLLAGVSCGAAIDMRPSYLLLAPLLLLLIAWRWRERRRERHAPPRLRFLCVGLFLAGLVVVSLPQSLASHRHSHTWSFVPGTAYHLTSVQLTEGLRLQRYETYVGVGHAPEMYYRDGSGARLLGEQKNHVVSGTAQYLGLIASHPITMAGVFVRHIVNGLDQRYTTPYVAHLDTGSHRWLRLAGFLLIFLALVRVLWRTSRKRLAPSRWRYPLALSLCCLTSIPSAVETRYFLPLYLLSYVIVLMPGWPTPVDSGVKGLRRYRTATIIAVSYLVFTAAVWHVVSETTRHLHLG